MDPATLGDPERPLRWTSKSAAKLAVGLRELGHELADRSVLRLLAGIGYTMQANVKTREGEDHPDRDAQFQYINDTAAAALQAKQPVISVDTKKKELVGEFKAVGREWARSGEPVQVNTHDFPSHARAKRSPTGSTTSRATRAGSMSESPPIPPVRGRARSRAWWEQLGRAAYPDARELTITADSGGSNSARGRLWKVELQTARRPDRPSDRGLPLPARDQEVEQNRAPPVQLHQPQLARQAADRLRRRSST